MFSIQPNLIFYQWIETLILTILLWIVAPWDSLKFIKRKFLGSLLIFAFLLFVPINNFYSLIALAFLIILVRWFFFLTPFGEACVFTITIFLLKYFIAFMSAFKVLLFSAKYVGNRIPYYMTNQEQIFSYFLYLLAIVFIYRFMVLSVMNYNLKLKYVHNRIYTINLLAIILFFIILNMLYRYYYTILNAILSVHNLANLLFIVINVFAIFIIVLIYFFNSRLIAKVHFNLYQNEYEKDNLTNVLTRTSGMKRLEELYDKSQKTKSNFVICFVDVNNLKITNDRFGHKEGDKMLSVIAREINRGLRDTDFVFRYGGDEFLICFNNCKLEDAMNAWHRINVSIDQANTLMDFKYRMSVSFGFSSFLDHQKLSLKELIAVADSEMYKYKHKYKSTLV